jgi:hypothetical protein
MEQGETYVGPMATKAPAKDEQRWSQDVTRNSNALDLEDGVFRLKDPREVAESLRRSADRSTRRKTTAHRSAMSMLTFYVNRAGRSLDRSQREVLERAKDELRKIHAERDR